MAKKKNKSELGPCQAFIGEDYCGKPAKVLVSDLKETRLNIALPGVIPPSYKFIGANRFCKEHEREGIFINADGTVTFGKSTYELEECADDGSNDI